VRSAGTGGCPERRPANAREGRLPPGSGGESPWWGRFGHVHHLGMGRRSRTRAGGQGGSDGRGRRGRPWNGEAETLRWHGPSSPATALGVIVCLTATVTILRWFVDGAGQAAALLYVLPIALGALRFGRRGGLGAAGFGIGAFIVLELVRARGDVDVTGWIAPLLAMALMGGLVGHLSESGARNDEARRLLAQHLDELRRARHAALEAGDSIVQRVAGARWMLEVGRSQEALEALNATLTDGITRVSGKLPALTPDPGRGETAGGPGAPG
jgi:hypothetical protein